MLTLYETQLLDVYPLPILFGFFLVHVEGGELDS